MDQAGLHVRRCEQREQGIDQVLDGHLVNEGGNESEKICNTLMGSDEADRWASWKPQVLMLMAAMNR